MNDLRDKLVLVVDDEIRLTGLVRMNLESEGVRVITASNGREALDLIREEMPEVVILDVMMPGMDGFETLRRIRTASQVPVIMLTAKDEENDRIKGLELGADDYVGKPFSHRELISRVRAVLRRHYLPAPSTPGHIVVDERLQIDFNKREVLIHCERINLPNRISSALPLGAACGICDVAQRAPRQSVGTRIPRRNTLSTVVRDLFATKNRTRPRQSDLYTDGARGRLPFQNH